MRIMSQGSGEAQAIRVQAIDEKRQRGPVRMAAYHPQRRRAALRAFLNVEVGTRTSRKIAQLHGMPEIILEDTVRQYIRELEVKASGSFPPPDKPQLRRAA